MQKTHRPGTSQTAAMRARGDDILIVEWTSNLKETLPCFFPQKLDRRERLLSSPTNGIHPVGLAEDARARQCRSTGACGPSHWKIGGCYR
jgi:hypothetical protein